ncbi:MAG: SDR family NAD(P)-dependent oxidoreductase [bacterium]|nr:SDR family NAD(P)-dependent oxidoreductase [bacterium]
MKRAGWVFALAGAAFAWNVLRRHKAVDLHHKVVIITGASVGIGKAAAHAFAAKGARVVLVARRAELLEQVKAGLAPYHVPVLVCPADVTNDDDLRRVVETVLREFGRIDVLVNNAGLSMGGAFGEHDPNDIRRLLDLNLYSVIRLTQLVLPVMLRQLSGHIVNVSSMASDLRTPGMSVYTASKAGMNALSDVLRRELDGTGVLISKVLPTWTGTDMISAMNVDHMRRARLVMEPLMKYDDAEDVAQAIVDAVRYKRSEVLMGGLGTILALRGARNSAFVTDLVYRYYFNRDELVKLLRVVG